LKKERINKIFNHSTDRHYPHALRPYKGQITKINKRRSELENKPDSELKELSIELKKQAQEGVPIDELQTDAFALSCEAARRVLRLQPFDVQVMAGIAIHEKNLVQMNTGEGKTLAAVFPAYLNALVGNGVHILTFNDYLARRDAGWMGHVYHVLGLSVGFVQEGMSIAQRQNAYSCDITYLTAKEAGFDFLRDQRCMKKEELVHRPFQYAIVDEADSILIDEARVPLVIAGDMPLSRTNSYTISKLVRSLDKKKDYYFDEYSRDVNYTDAGLDRLEKLLECGNLHALENNDLLSSLNLALQAECLLHRDIDYIVREGKVELIDEFTGRVADKRRWPYGLQTAIEAKESLAIQPEGTILGSITLQHFLGLYPKLAGMTATAKTSEEEFDTFYGLKVVVIPPNRPCIRIDLPDMVFTHKEAREKALITEMMQVNAAGRPVLVGTASVEESERLALSLQQTGIKCSVLNAKNDEKEAAIIAEAGDLYAVTISTNMAGRGTDIRLGGKNEENRDKVSALGGLYVVGTNRHESRRIDDQLRGRSGRQGDPGSSCFFISMEDDLMVRFRLKELIPTKLLPSTQDDPIENPIVAREIARVQRIVEGQNLEIRKTLRNYSFMVEQQRRIIQEYRMNILLDDEKPELISEHYTERYNKLLSIVSKEVLTEVEKQITLFHIDKAWTEYLGYITYIREGIHLLSLGGKNPSFEFQKTIIKAFEEMKQTINARIISTFTTAEITEKGIDAKREGMTGPSSTWTYLINDNPFENQLFKVLAGSHAVSFGVAMFLSMNLPIVLVGLLVQAVRRLWKRMKK
jgi:preprotein translocase subunit SecA